jgi:hypothetical protein
MRAVDNTDLEIELGEWVIASAVDHLRRWREAGLRIEIGINISAYHMQSAGFVPRLREQAQRYAPRSGERWLQIEGAGNRRARRHRPHQRADCCLPRAGHRFRAGRLRQRLFLAHLPQPA